MTEILESLIVRDFRAISGEITVPLDAPVVLIHAANAVGKTSVMSAIELGLTGRLPNFERTDPRYSAHLINKAATSATITLKAREQDQPAVFTIDQRGFVGEPLLPRNLYQYFSERCYLGQAMLSRLLEMCAPLDEGLDSALLVFVKDLLGVDRLDALIDGLHMAGHVARIRAEIPEFRYLENEASSLATSVESLRDSLNSVQQSEKAQGALVLSILSQLTNFRDPSILESSKRIEALMRSEQEEHDLASLISQRLQLETLRESWMALATRAQVDERELEEQSAVSQRALAEWENSDGQTLVRVVARLEKLLTNIPSPQVVEPSYAHAAATTVAGEDLERCKRQLAENEARLKRITELNKLIAVSSERLSKITDRLAKLGDSAHSLAKILGELLSYIHSNDCPVCGRNYSEISHESLANKVSSNVSNLSEQADLLKALTAERNELERGLASLRREHSTLTSAVLSEALQADLCKRTVELSDAAGQLRDLEASSALGTQLRKNASEIERVLASVRKRNRQGNATRLELATIAEHIKQPGPLREETTEQVLGRLDESIRAAEKSLDQRAGLRKSLEVQWSRLADLRRDIKNREQSFKQEDARLKKLRSKLDLVEQRKEIAKSVSRAAVRSKGTIVKRLFTESLNRTWRDLFIRLAPEETFVPRFAVPNAGGALRIELETLHRDGDVAGSPQTMLSTGNLNTAALALFLALNMSVETKVPILMLDDPVQSMDEVHTAQLAALLRMMSKGRRSRQIIIAVHERSLFEYLAFELAPSFAGDTLLTVALDRTRDGLSVVLPRYYKFKQETAVA